MYFTRESSSDLLAELDVWNKVTKEEKESYKEKINWKNYKLVKEMVEKMKEHFGKVFSTGNREELLQCIMSGFVDTLHILGWNTYETSNEKKIRLSKYSCTYSPDFLLGKDRVIEYQDSWGYKSEMTIVEQATRVSMKQLQKLAPHLFTRERIGDPFYSAYTDTCKQKEQLIYDGWTTVDTYYVDCDDKVLQKKAKEEYMVEKESKERVQYEEERREYVVVNGKEYPLINDWLKDRQFICLSEEELFQVSEKTIKNVYGKPILVRCSGFSNENLDLLRKKIIEAKGKEKKDLLQATLPKEATVKLTLLKDWVKKIGNIEICSGVTTNICFQVTDRGKVRLVVEDHDEIAKKSNSEAVRLIFQNEIRQNFSDKKFLVERAGKKVENKKSKEAKEFFFDFVNEMKKNLTLDNLFESLEELSLMYEEVRKDYELVL